MDWKRNEFAGVKRVPPTVNDWVQAGFGFDYKDDMGKVHLDCRDPVIVFIGPQVITHYRMHDPATLQDNVVWLIRLSIEPSDLPPETGLVNEGPFWYPNFLSGNIEEAREAAENLFINRNQDPNMLDEFGRPTCTDKIVLWAGKKVLDYYDGQWNSEVQKEISNG